MKRIAMFLAFFVLGLQLLMAQTVQITGTVTSKEDGQPLPGASVLVKGTTIGTTTDFNGKYTLSIPSDAQTLVISFVGMKTMEVAIAGQTAIDAILEADAVGLEEVVVTALGVSRSQKSLTYSVTQVSNKDLVNGGNRSALNALQGKVAGLNITSSSGAPGASSRILLRGYSSISGNNEPLFVVDGIPVTNRTTNSTDLNNNYDFGNAMNDLNPNDIETFSVLKGAAASALYGSRAANGVILITTKKGAQNSKLKVDYNGTVTFSNYIPVLKMQDTFGQGWSGHFAYDENGSWGPKFDGKERLYGRVIDGQQRYKPFVGQPNNIKDFFDTGVMVNNAIALTGGNEKNTFYVSYSNLHDDGILPTDKDNYSRNTILLNGSTSGKFFRISGSVNFINKQVSSVSGGQGNSVYNDLMQIPRDFSIVDMKDYNSQFNDLNGYYTQYGVVNPYFSMNEDGNKLKENHIYGNIEAVADITKKVSLTVKVGNDLLTNQGRNWKAVVKPASWSQNFGSSSEDAGSYAETAYMSNEFTADVLLRFSPEFGDFSMNGVVGGNLNARYSHSTGAAINNLTIPNYYNLSNSSESPTTAGSTNEKRLVGIYGQSDIGYKKAVFLNIGARNDWSSTLPKGSNSFFYPTIGLSALITEIFPGIQNTISYAKLRASYGMTGNDPSPYSLQSVMVAGGVGYSWVNVGFPLNSYSYKDKLTKPINAFEVGNTLGNDALKPELTKEIELGAEIKILNNRLGGEFTYYKRNTTNQIMPAPISTTSGYNLRWVNLGNVQNKGIELQVKAIPVQTKDFEWTVIFNYTRNRNKVIELSPELPKITSGGFTGVGIFTTAGQPMGFFEGRGIQKTADGKVIVSSKGIPIATTVPEYMGDGEHEYVDGFTNSITWKGAYFSFTLDYRKGGVFYSRTADINYFVGHAWKTTYNDRQPFIIPNSVMLDPTDPSGKTYIPNNIAVTMAEVSNYWGSSFGGGLEGEKASIIDKSSFRIRELTLGYRLPSKWVSKTPFTNIDVSLVAQNILIWLPASNTFADPDQSTFGTNIGAEFGEFSGAPTVRRIGFSLKLSL
jgi:TonB-linked SusC/RagA family outer membrane protein